MVRESYPCYVRVGESSATEELIELPTEANGSMLLTTITAQYPDAIALKFKSDSGAWRGVRVSEGVLDVPLEGWGNREYVVTVPKKAEKRKLAGDDAPGKKTKQDMLSDLIVLGLPYSATENDLRSYFEKYGSLAHSEVKFDPLTKKSRGFGFIRYTSVEEVEQVLAASHSMGGRNLEVRFPNKPGHDSTPTKLFIGRLPHGTTVEDLKDCFSDYTPLKDVYIPQNFRGFGFITFSSQSDAQEVLNSTHVIKGNVLNISHPAPKPGEMNQQPMQQVPNYGYQGNMQAMQGGYQGYQGMQGNMQGGMQGNMQGGMQGNMQGAMQGNMQGGMQGNMQGYMQGNTQGGGMQQMGTQGYTAYGNQQQGNKMNSGYYTNGYYQPAGKIQSGKV